MKMTKTELRVAQIVSVGATFALFGFPIAHLVLQAARSLTEEKLNSQLIQHAPYRQNDPKIHVV